MTRHGVALKRVGKMSRSSEVVLWVLISKWRRRDQKK
jgi:hypothetical protein